jgi:hypothetical protein
MKIHLLLPELLLLTGMVANPVEMMAQPGKKSSKGKNTNTIRNGQGHERNE